MNDTLLVDDELVINDGVDADLAELANEFRAGGSDYKLNMEGFIEMYGVQLNVPAIYIYDSKLNPANPT